MWRRITPSTPQRSSDGVMIDWLDTINTLLMVPQISRSLGIQGQSLEGRLGGAFRARDLFQAIQCLETGCETENNASLVSHISVSTPSR